MLIEQNILSLLMEDYKEIFDSEGEYPPKKTEKKD